MKRLNFAFFIFSFICLQLSVQSQWIEDIGKMYYNNGYIGIGTSNPSLPLHFSTGFQIGTSTTASDNYHFYSHDGGLNIYNGNNGAGSHLMVLKNNGNVGIGTTNTTGKFTVKGTIHLQDPSNDNLRVTMGYYKSEYAEYGYLSALDYGDPLTGKPLILNGKGTGEAWGNVGIGQLYPIQALDIGGRLNIRNGVIQNGVTPITSTDDLGLYSTRQGFNIRIVTKSAPIQFYTDGGTNVIGGTPTMVVHQDGIVGIGTSNPSDGVTSNLKLAVNGTIKAKEILVTINNWSDLVFKSDYKLLSLSEIETYINENGHLPEIPSEQEVMENGVELGNMTSKLLQKIEELTLYIIDQKKELEKLKEFK